MGSEILSFPSIFLFQVPGKLCGIRKYEKYLSQSNFTFFNEGCLSYFIKFFWNHHSLVRLSSFPLYFVIPAHLTFDVSFKLLRTELNKAMENKAPTVWLLLESSFRCIPISQSMRSAIDLQSSKNSFNYTSNDWLKFSSNRSILLICNSNNPIKNKLI